MKVEDVIDLVKSQIGQCADAKAIEYINLSLMRLADTETWRTMETVVDLCNVGEKGVFTLPREIETPLGIAAGGSPKMFRSRWFEYHQNAGTTTRWTPWRAADDQGVHATARDIAKSARVVALGFARADKGLIVVVVGYDKDGRKVMRQTEDGEWMEGWAYSVLNAEDFPEGVPYTDGYQPFYRLAVFPAINQFITETPSNLETGQELKIDTITGESLVPFYPGQPGLFVRVEGSNRFTLHGTAWGADNNLTPLAANTAHPDTVVRFINRRTWAVLTKFLPVGSNFIGIETGDLVRIGGNTIPKPYEADTDYFARVVESGGYTVHRTRAEAQENVNPIDALSAGTSLSLNLRRTATPVSIIKTGANHRLLTGDTVRFSTTVRLPSPLREGTDYYVRVVSNKAIQVFESPGDALEGKNQIIMQDAGEGVQTVVKTIPASIDPSGVVTARNHNLEEDDLIIFLTDGSYFTVGEDDTRPGPTVAYMVTSHAGNTFSFKDLNSEDSDVTVESTGGGQLYVAVSRAFTLNFEEPVQKGWDIDASFVSTGDALVLSTEGRLPDSGVPVESGDQVFARVGQDSVVQLFKTKKQAEDGTAFIPTDVERTGDVAKYWFDQDPEIEIGDYIEAKEFNDDSFDQKGVVTNVGEESGEYFVELANEGGDESKTAVTDGYLSYWAIEAEDFSVRPVFAQFSYSVNTEIKDNTVFRLVDLGVMKSGAVVRVSSDATLPSGLQGDTDYIVEFLPGNQFLRLRLASNNQIQVIGSIGSGPQAFTQSIDATINVLDPVEVKDHQYSNGDAAVIVSEDPPQGLSNNQEVFIRTIDRGRIELYETEAQAVDLNSTDGRIVTTSRTGYAVRLRTVIETPEFVKIESIRKAKTSMPVEIWAWDTGRSEDLLCLASLDPNHLYSAYRRFRLSGDHEWVRVRGKLGVPRVFKRDDEIPIRDPMAIAMMVKALWLSLNGGIEDAKEYELEAYKIMRQGQASLAGSEAFSIQINDPVMLDSRDTLV